MDIRLGKSMDKGSIRLGKLSDECKHRYKKVNYGMLALDLENHLINVSSRLGKLIDKCYRSIMLVKEN